MKLKSLCLAMAVLGMSSSYVFAADGEINFVGKIVDSSCQIDSSTASPISVNLGPVPKGSFNSEGDGPGIGFSIALTGCTAGKYQLILDGASPSGQPNILALTGQGGTGVAKNVGIKIKDITGRAVTLSKPLEEDDAEITVDETGKGTFYLTAGYYKYGEVESGSANATAYFTVIQK